MISQITGYFKGIDSTGCVIIDVNGVGFSINVSDFTRAKVATKTSKVLLYTYMHVRDNEISLFGFNCSLEKDIFMHLIGIAGIGPKLAINILSGLPLNDLIMAIITENIKLLSSIKGIGKRTAERIVLELKEPLAKEGMLVSDEKSDTQSTVIAEAILALTSLGIDQTDAHKAVASASENNDNLEEIVFLALKSLN